MSPLDQRKQVPNLKEDGEGSVQVKLDPDMKIDGAKVFAAVSYTHLTLPTIYSV